MIRALQINSAVWILKIELYSKWKDNYENRYTRTF